jgi:hypothetical protein
MILLIVGSGLTPSAAMSATTATPVVKIEAEGIQAALKGTCTIYKDRSGITLGGKHATHSNL